MYKAVSIYKIIRTDLLNMTMQELADKLGVSKQAVYMWESEKKPIPQKRIEQLAELTGIDSSYFESTKEMTEKLEQEFKWAFYRKQFLELDKVVKN